MIDTLLSMIDTTATGAKFATFTYTAKGTGEVSIVRVALGETTTSIYEKDIAALTILIPMLAGIEKEAAEAILKSRHESLEKGIGNNSAYTCRDTYTAFDSIPGVKFHNETAEMYVTGLVVEKTVVTPGEYKTVNSKPLTVAKNKISKVLPSGTFRQYKLEKVSTVTVMGETLEIVTE